VLTLTRRVLTLPRRVLTLPRRMLTLPRCACTAAACRNRPVSLQRGLTLAAHVYEQSLWGLDCYTRANVVSAA
jgi:hypothetical protein